MNKQIDNRDRSRVKLACDTCRAKKRKCDGQEPTCGRCLKHANNNCRFSYHMDKRRPFTKSYVNSLKKQILGLETTLAENRIKCTAEKETVTCTVSKLVDEEAKIARDTKELQHQPTECRESSIKGEEDVVDINNLIDSYGKFKPENNTIYFYGPRSTLSFIDGHIPLTSATQSIEDCRSIELDHTASASSDHEIFLCELYFTFQNVSFFFLWKELFYDQLKLPEAMRNPTLISESLICAVLALGSVFDHSEANQSQATLYAIRASKLLQEEIAIPAVPTVQCCGLLAIFYISRNQDCLAWHYCGAAVSSAYSLGLNMDNNLTSENTIPEDEAELRRMTFWAVYTLERALNNILGRPTFLKTESIISMVPTGAGISDYSTWANPHRSRQLEVSDKIFARSFSLVTYTVELLITSSKPLDHIYLSFKPSAPSELELIVNKANIELLLFESSLPNFLRLHSIMGPRTRNLASPGPYIFQLRYHNVHILLHRVFFIRDAEQSPFNPKILSHKKVCYDSAINIIKLISQYDEVFGLENFDICSADIICTAAIVFLYLFKNPFLEEATTKEMYDVKVIMKTCNESYKKLKDSLSRIAITNYWANKNVHVLDQLETEWNVDFI